MGLLPTREGVLFPYYFSIVAVAAVKSTDLTNTIPHKLLRVV
jgi:hypothetical protein